MFGVILAGGSGSRLWPLSRELYPKQLLNLCAEKSLLQSTFEMLNKFIPASEIISVTNSKHQANVKMQLGDLCESPVILAEPLSKNTAPAIAICVKYILETSDNDETILVVPSDLLIKENEKFKQTVISAQKYVDEGKIVTFGIKPTYPETGFGYIHSVDNKVTKFTEKPDNETVLTYLKDENYYWNSGIFMFKVSTIMKELETHCPDIMNILQNIKCSDNKISFTEFDKMPNISIDYALMEKVIILQWLNFNLIGKT